MVYECLLLIALTKKAKNMGLLKKLIVQPEEAAESIYKIQQKGENVFYIKWNMLIIRNTPEWTFKRISI